LFMNCIVAKANTLWEALASVAVKASRLLSKDFDSI
jgi:hypothetical protein